MKKRLSCIVMGGKNKLVAHYMFEFVAPPTQGTWRSNDYVSAVRLVDACY